MALRNISCFFGGCLALVLNAYSQEGELQIYENFTQNGTHASKTFRDEHKRAYRIDYYTARNFQRPTSGADLVPREIQFYSYDALSRKTWVGFYLPDFTFKRSIEHTFSDEGKLPSSVSYRDSDGIVRQKKIRGEVGLAHLFFDDTGTHVIALNGAPPAGIDLTDGWGKSVDGVACGLGLSRKSGAVDSFLFCVTARNLSQSSREIVETSQYHTIGVDLKNAGGQTVPQNVEYITKRNAALHRGKNDNPQRLPPGECRSSTYQLKEWYGKLPPGEYVLTVRRRAAGEQFSLLSNPVKITITE